MKARGLMVDFRLLTCALLVLHGGSGTPELDLKKAISLGISKVNVATELVQAFKKSLLSQWNTEPVPWMPVSIAEATEAMVPVVEKWIRLTGAAGKG